MPAEFWWYIFLKNKKKQLLHDREPQLERNCDVNLREVGCENGM